MEVHIDTKTGSHKYMYMYMLGGRESGMMGRREDGKMGEWEMEGIIMCKTMRRTSNMVQNRHLMVSTMYMVVGHHEYGIAIVYMLAELRIGRLEAHGHGDMYMSLRRMHLALTVSGE